MKKILFTFFAIVSLFTISSCGDNKDEPSLDEDGWIDPVFAKVLQERGYIADAKTVTPLDVASIESIDVSGEFGINPGPIESVKGLNYFTSLTELFCLNNQLTTLDISNNTQLTDLSCYDNQLATLDVSNLTQLTTLSCGYNQLTALDVSNNTQLTKLECYNNQLTKLDVSNNAQLTSLFCAHNRLTTLDVSNDTQLTRLECHDNQLTTLDVSNNTQLFLLWCSRNKLTTLDVSNNTQLKTLYCYGNQLRTLDVSNNIQLTDLDCSDNQLTSLDIVGHFFRNDHGKLYKTAETSVGLMPYSLIDHLAFPLLGDGIGIGAAFCQKSTDYATGALIMILHNVVPDQVCSSSRSECLTRTLVHVYDPAVAVYHCHRTIHPISPLGQKFIFHLKSLSVFIPSAKLIFFL